MNAPDQALPLRVPTGVPGLDNILGGGFPNDRLYLIQGDPGTGKTTLALQFLLEGKRAGEKGLFITLSETADELRSVAASHGWSLDGKMDSPIDVSYLSDTVLLMRYFEAGGKIRQAVSVMKKRTGAHERTIREFMMSSSGLRVGQPLSEFRGILTGVPEYVGKDHPLLKDADGG